MIVYNNSVHHESDNQSIHFLNIDCANKGRFFLRCAPYGKDNREDKINELNYLWQRQSRRQDQQVEKLLWPSRVSDIEEHPGRLT